MTYGVFGIWRGKDTRRLRRVVSRFSGIIMGRVGGTLLTAGTGIKHKNNRVRNYTLLLTLLYYYFIIYNYCLLNYKQNYRAAYARSFACALG
jgi:hypothetical protein